MLQLGTGAGAHGRSDFSCEPARAIFRDPMPGGEAPYIAVLGGSATFAKSVDRPYPDLVQAATGMRVVNLGVQSGGPDVYLAEPAVLNVIARAELAIVQLTGAESISNPYYSVHSRRNDRFLAASPALVELFPEVDLTDIHFTRHLLQVLARTDANRFAQVVQALKTTWLARMLGLLVHLPLRRRLLWVSDTAPADSIHDLDHGVGPQLVDRPMLARLRPLGGEVTTVLPSARAKAEDAAAYPMAVNNIAPATELPGPAAHREIAAALVPAISDQLRRGNPPPLILRHADAVR